MQVVKDLPPGCSLDHSKSFRGGELFELNNDLAIGHLCAPNLSLRINNLAQRYGLR
jgi:hypothetical protein